MIYSLWLFLHIALVEITVTGRLIGLVQVGFVVRSSFNDVEEWMRDDLFQISTGKGQVESLK